MARKISNLLSIELIFCRYRLEKSPLAAEESEGRVGSEGTPLWVLPVQRGKRGRRGITRVEEEKEGAYVQPEAAMVWTYTRNNMWESV